MNDDRLQALIDEIESGGGVRAPAHMKEEIFARIADEKKRRGRAQLILYSLEVVVVSAAAVLLIIFAPLGQLAPKRVELPREALVQSMNAAEWVITLGREILPTDKPLWNETEDNEYEE